MSRASVLADGRMRVEESFVDTVSVVYRGGRTFDPTTGKDTPTEIERFRSPCKVAVGSLGSLIPTAKDDPAGGRITTELRLIMYLPVTAPKVYPDDICVMVAIGPDSDPQLLGRRLRVVAPTGQTYGTARRFSVEEQLA